MVKKYLEKEEKNSQSQKIRPSKQKMASHLISQHILSFHSIVNKSFPIASGTKEMVPNKEKKNCCFLFGRQDSHQLHRKNAIGLNKGLIFSTVI